MFRPFTVITNLSAVRDEIVRQKMKDEADKRVRFNTAKGFFLETMEECEIRHGEARELLLEFLNDLDKIAERKSRNLIIRKE